MNNEFINEIETKMRGTLTNLEKRFTTVRAGRANPSSLDGVMVDYYGSMTPLKSLATISVPEATQLLIKPFDRGCLSDIEKAINSANLGFNPSNDGETIRIVIQALTEERRKELAKEIRKIAEEAKVAIRAIRRDGIDEAKAKQKNSEITEEELKSAETEIQKITDK